MLSLAWNVPNCALPENITSAKEHIFLPLSMTTSTGLTSAVTDSGFHSLTFHSLLYSHSSFISLINNRWDTEDLSWTFRNCLWSHQQMSFEISKLFLFLLKILLQTRSTSKGRNTELIYINFVPQSCQSPTQSRSFSDLVTKLAVPSSSC